MKTARERFKKFIEDFYLVLVLVFLYAPILVMMVLSFNSSKSRSQWGGFTLKWYTQMFESATIMDALYNTLLIAFLSALIATILGTAAAIGLSAMKKLPRTQQYPDAKLRYRDRDLPDADVHRLRDLPGL